MFSLADILKKNPIVKTRDMIVRDIIIAKVMEFCGMELAREAILVSRNRVRLHVSPAQRFKIRPHDRHIISALSKNDEYPEPLRINSIH
jgi:hypothetical protein